MAKLLRQPKSPSDVLTFEYVLSMGWTREQFAKRCGLPLFKINEVMDGTRRITRSFAIEFARVFGTSINFWEKLQKDYNVWKAQSQFSFVFPKLEGVEFNEQLFTCGFIHRRSMEEVLCNSYPVINASSVKVYRLVNINKLLEMYAPDRLPKDPEALLKKIREDLKLEGSFADKWFVAKRTNNKIKLVATLDNKLFFGFAVI